MKLCFELSRLIWICKLSNISPATSFNLSGRRTSPSPRTQRTKLWAANTPFMILGYYPKGSPDQYVLIIHSNVESGQKMIQFNIHSKLNLKYSINRMFVQYLVKNILFKNIEKKWIKIMWISNLAWKPVKRYISYHLVPYWVPIYHRLGPYWVPIESHFRLIHICKKSTYTLPFRCLDESMIFWGMIFHKSTALSWKYRSLSWDRGRMHHKLGGQIESEKMNDRELMRGQIIFFI